MILMMPQVEEVLPAIYRIEVPLAGSPLKSINSYLLKGKERNLIIDTGMNTDECRQALGQALRLLNVDLQKTDFFITHFHADHLGLVFQLASEKSSVFLNGPDLAALKSAIFWKKAIGFVPRHGFPESEARYALKIHPASSFKLKDLEKFKVPSEGDTITVGNYCLQCLETPGHSHGNMCLYEPQEKILFSGDHILGDITPNIALNIDWSYNPLKKYISSLEKIYNIDVNLVLPGHRSIISNCRQRITELINHHRQRNEEILAVLKKSPANAYEIASKISWDMPGTWDHFPVIQKWFAVSEVLSHLKDLEVKGLVLCEALGDNFIFRRK